MKKFTLFLLFVFSLGIKAQAEFSFPACQDKWGHPVRFSYTDATQGGPAFSIEIRGQPYIFINPQIVQHYATSQATLMYIYLHECGHARLGQLVSGPSSPSVQKQRELAADCWAAKAFKQLGYSDRDLMRVDMDMGRLPPDPEHPGGRVRVRDLNQCYSSGFVS